eukprot:6220942-Prymnesium_polylepis.1
MLGPDRSFRSGVLVSLEDQHARCLLPTMVAGLTACAATSAAACTAAHAAACTAPAAVAAQKSLRYQRASARVGGVHPLGTDVQSENP